MTNVHEDFLAVGLGVLLWGGVLTILTSPIWGPYIQIARPEGQTSQAFSLSDATDVLTAVIAVLALGVSLYAIRRETRSNQTQLLHQRRQYEIELGVRLLDRWREIPEDDTIEYLNLFEDVGYYVQEGHVRIKYVWHNWLDDIRHWKKYASDTIEARQREDPTIWRELSWLISEVERYDTELRSADGGSGTPTPDA